MSTGSLIVGGGIIATIIASCWESIKAIFNKIWGLVFIKITFNGNESAWAAVSWILHNCKAPLRCDFGFSASRQYVRPMKRNQMVLFHLLNPGIDMWWYKHKPLWVNSEASGQGNSITFIRGFFDKEKLAFDIVSYFNEACKIGTKDHDYSRYKIVRLTGSLGEPKSSRMGGRDGVEKSAEVAPGFPPSINFDLDVSIPIGWKTAELGMPVEKNAMDTLSLEPDVLFSFSEVRRWMDSENWYKERKIPWKRGLLLTGSPGTGKTAFVRALGQELNLPIFCFDLSSMSNGDFVSSWDRVCNNAPCIALFEDIDGVFNGRENIMCQGKMEHGLSFDCFLNILDGADNSEGILKIVTTNDPKKVDPALGVASNGCGMSTRPGRIDRIVEFRPLTHEGRVKMANRIFDGFEHSLWQNIIKEGEKDTGAQFQERCCRLANDLFWSGVKLNTVQK
jgi:hypothetical protein